MPCYFPVGTYDLQGKVTKRPCGSCIGCKLEYSRQWAVRCVHEAQLHEENSFITLTYNNENLPKDGNIDKTELQKFIRRLRKDVSPKKIRYFGCGEYGNMLNRPHYHLALFGHDFDDKKTLFYNKKTSRKNYQAGIIYRAESLEKVWKKGYSSIGELTFESAGYIARYCTKKITGENAENHYQGKTPEFALMSRRPGLGRDWIEKYLTDVYPKDYMTLKGKIMKPLRYYDSVYEKLQPQNFLKLKEKRKENLEKALDKDPQMKGECYRRYQKMDYRRQVTKNLNRGLENGKN